MSESSSTPPAEHPSEDHAPHDPHGYDVHASHIPDSTFVKVFGALCVFTLVSFLANQIFGTGVLSFLIIGTVAVCKALLVVVFFMHLKLDWKKLFVFIVPIMVLAPMIVAVLYP